MRTRGINLQQILLAVALLAALAWNLTHAAEVRGVGLETGPTGTRAELMLDGSAEYKLISLANPDRLVVDLPASRAGTALALPAPAGVVKAVRRGQPDPGTLRIVFDLAEPVAALSPRLESGADGARLVIEWPGDGHDDPIARIAVASAAPRAATVVDAPSPAQAPAVDPAAASAAATSRLVAGLATLSLPGLAPFITEFLLLIGTFTRYPVLAVLAASALVLSAIYILWMYQRMMTGPVPAALEHGEHKIRDLLPRELAVVVPLIALLLVLGIYPKPALDIINPAVTHTLTTVDQSDPAPRMAEGPAR